MSPNGNRPSILPSSPPETDDIDASWDDEPFDEPLALDDDDYDRATVIPSDPPEKLAARMMDDGAVDPGSLPPLPPASGDLPNLPSQPPPLVSAARGQSHDRGIPELSAPGGPVRHLSETSLPVQNGAPSGAVREQGPITRPDLPGSSSRREPEDLGPPSSLPPALGVTTRTNPATPDSRADAAAPELEIGGEEDFSLELDLDHEPPSTAGTALELADRQPRPEGRRTSPEGPVVDEDEDEPPPSAGSSAIADMKDRYAVGDFTGALVIAESILEHNPEDPDAKRYADSCREVLTQMYSARVGDLRQVVSVAIPAEEIRWLSLDHRAGFLLSLVDGHSTVEDILDISGMPRLDALRLMYTLLQQRVISLSS